MTRNRRSANPPCCLSLPREQQDQHSSSRKWPLTRGNAVDLSGLEPLTSALSGEPAPCQIRDHHRGCVLKRPPMSAGGSRRTAPRAHDSLLRGCSHPQLAPTPGSMPPSGARNPIALIAACRRDNGLRDVVSNAERYSIGACTARIGAVALHIGRLTRIREGPCDGAASALPAAIDLHWSAKSTVVTLIAYQPRGHRASDREYASGNGPKASDASSQCSGETGVEAIQPVVQLLYQIGGRYDMSRTPSGLR